MIRPQADQRLKTPRGQRDGAREHRAFRVRQHQARRRGAAHRARDDRFGSASSRSRPGVDQARPRPRPPSTRPLRSRADAARSRSSLARPGLWPRPAYRTTRAGRNARRKGKVQAGSSIRIGKKCRSSQAAIASRNVGTSGTRQTWSTTRRRGPSLAARNRPRCGASSAEDRPTVRRSAGSLDRLPRLSRRLPQLPPHVARRPSSPHPHLSTPGERCSLPANQAPSTSGGNHDRPAGTRHTVYSSGSPDQGPRQPFPTSRGRTSSPRSVPSERPCCSCVPYCRLMSG